MTKSQAAFPVFFQEIVTSTMDVGKSLASVHDIQSPFIMAAVHQTMGKGRGGSQWQDIGNDKESFGVSGDLQKFEDLGSLVATLSEFPPLTFVLPAKKIVVPMTWVSQMMGCAVLDALRKTFELVMTQFGLTVKSEFDFPFYLKWPNDILYSKEQKQFSKICGILCETSIQSDGENIGNEKFQMVSIGMGINFFEFPQHFSPKATSFFDAILDFFEIGLKQRGAFQKELGQSEMRSYFLKHFATGLLKEFHEYLFFERPVDQIKSLVLERSLPLETKLSVNKAQQAGEFLGLEDDGALILKNSDTPVYSGDVELSVTSTSEETDGDKNSPREDAPLIDEEDVHTKSIFQTMRRARTLKQYPPAPVKEKEDFRRLGFRLENVDDERLDAYMARKFKFCSRKKWQERITNGEVLIEKNSPKQHLEFRDVELEGVKPTYKVKNFDQIWFYHPPEYEPECIDTLNVIFDDRDVCVFEKPPNLVIHSTGLYGKNTLLAVAEKMGYEGCFPVHRIDRETSGLLLCARRTETRRLLSDSFKKGEVQKMYFAITKQQKNCLVDELPDIFSVTAPIGEPLESKIRMKLWIGGRNPMPARTDLIALARHEDFTLLACFPRTGRTNQIRIHLACLGHWIVGDKMYHPDEEVFLEFYDKGLTQKLHKILLFPRHLLHNTGIQMPYFENPVVCPLSQDMVEFSVTQSLLKNAKISADVKDQAGVKERLMEIFRLGEVTDFSTVKNYGDEIIADK